MDFHSVYVYFYTNFMMTYRPYVHMHLTVFTSHQVGTSPLGAPEYRESPNCPVATDQSLLLSSGNMSTGVLEQ